MRIGKVEGVRSKGDFPPNSYNPRARVRQRGGEEPDASSKPEAPRPKGRAQKIDRTESRIEARAELKQLQNLRSFLEKFFPASTIVSKQREIISIMQLQGETLREYWDKFNQLCASCPDRQISEHLLILHSLDGLSMQDKFYVDVAVGGSSSDEDNQSLDEETDPSGRNFDDEPIEDRYYQLLDPFQELHAEAMKFQYKAAQVARIASPNGWISDDEVRHRFSYFRKFRTVEWIAHQGLANFVQMKGDYYPDLVEEKLAFSVSKVKAVLFKLIEHVIPFVCQRKGINIIIDDDVWLSFIGLKVEGYKSHVHDSKVNNWTNKKEIYKDFLRYLGRCVYAKCHKDKDTNQLVAVKSDHMIEVGCNHGYNLPFGVFISKALEPQKVDLTDEIKVECTKSNEIGKTTLTCIGLKKNVDGWVFKDVQTPIVNVTGPSNSDETPSSFTPHTEFERYVMEHFQRTSTRILKVEKSIFIIEKKVDEIVENYTRSASSTDKSDDKEETTKEDSMETSDSD
ncbi:hypothetical protein V8G54_010275 [Vigna mungo]|uniref:Retrotransposon gag domain-containing protein n=1 Tax=Vigna mungo TaxID=3915 RepID=A0AAQ3NX92_VIGMU